MQEKSGKSGSLRMAAEQFNGSKVKIPGPKNPFWGNGINLIVRRDDLLY
jgi:hypothetical protein